MKIVVDLKTNQQLNGNQKLGIPIGEYQHTICKFCNTDLIKTIIFETYTKM